jgi:hypothetical protein
MNFEKQGRIMMLISSLESQAEKKFKETGRGMEEFTVPAGTDPHGVLFATYVTIEWNRNRV